MSSKEIKVKLKDKDKEKDFNIVIDEKYETFIKKINSIIEEEYNIKIKETNNLYKIYYFDEDNDKLYIKSEEDFSYFINLDVSNIYLEINDSLINSIILDEFKKLKKQNDGLKRQNNFLKQKIEAIEEKSKIQLEKIKILEIQKENEIEKSKILLKSLEDEQNQKNIIAEQLEETKKLNESMSFIINNSKININNKNDNENEDKAKDILLNNLKEENKMLKGQLEKERNIMKNIDTIQEEYKYKINQSIIAIEKIDD